MIVLIELIGWVATVFRCWGMIARKADTVKYLVSIGNLLWMINGIMTVNYPLIASNAICLAIMLVEIIKTKSRNTKARKGSTETLNIIKNDAE